MNFFWFLFFLLLLAVLWIFFVFGIIYLVDLDDKKTRCLSTVVNSSTDENDSFEQINSFPLTTVNEVSNDAFDSCRFIYHLDHEEFPLPRQATFIGYIFYLSNKIGLVAKDSDNTTFIVFRGTTNYEEWRKDLLFQQVKYSNLSNLTNQVSQPNIVGLLHQGFLEIYQAIRDQIAIYINGAANIILAGHSLGAALAILTFSEYSNESKINHVYVYGSPRVGNQEFKDNLTNQSKITRYENRADLVCNLPLAVSPNFLHEESPDNVFLYSHVGFNIEFEQNTGSYLTNHSLHVYLTHLESQL